ncbi:hypothetical protein ANO11243_031140 [Dothideomycetidae sp. 11243]|nr:hypothetical protein ANO11243_031140 [fungal sp. No.11243]
MITGTSQRTETGDSASPTSRHVDPIRRSSSHKHIGAVFRKIGNAIRKRSPGTPSMNAEMRMDIDTRLSTSNSNAPTATDNSRPPSFEAHSADGSQPASLHQDSVRSATGSFDSHISNTTAISTISHISRQSTRDDRARVFHSRYGLSMDPNFTPDRILQPRTGGDDVVARVQKSARLRMHTKCHVCNTAFRSSSCCPQCKHRRCRMCPRSLPKGVQALVDQTKLRLESIAEPIQADLSTLNLASVVCTQDRTSNPCNNTQPAAFTTTSSTISNRAGRVPEEGGLDAHAWHARDLCLTIEQAIANLGDYISSSRSHFNHWPVGPYWHVNNVFSDFHE